MPSDLELKKRFHKLRDDLEKAFADAKPAQDAYDVVQKQIQALQVKLKPLAEAKRKAEEPVAAIQREMGQISRWLKGKTALPEHEGAN